MMVERFTVRLVLDGVASETLLDEVAHLAPVVVLRDDGTVLLEVSVLNTSPTAASEYVRSRLELVGADRHLVAA